ncbi:hypothetical protein [Aureisphaera sp.]
MQEIDPIYKNDFGLGFHWKKSGTTLDNRVQIIFRDIGFYLKKEEVLHFSKQVDEVRKQGHCRASCKANCCRSLLLKTPSKLVDLAISPTELEAVDDLLKGILFHLNLREYLRTVSLN